MDTCAGKGAKVGVGSVVGVRSTTGMDVAVATAVGVDGFGVTGKAVGTGPGGFITFFA